MIWKLRSREVKCKEPKATQLGEQGLEPLMQQPEVSARAGTIRPILQREKTEAWS